MPAPLSPWWKEAHDAAQLLASSLNAAAVRAGQQGTYAPPAGAPPPRRRRRPASLRHLAEVIRAHRLAPGIAVDKDIVARVLAADLRYITDPLLVTAVARASSLIARTPLTDADARRLAVACAHVTALIKAAEDADRQAPKLVPAVRPGAEPAGTEPRQLVIEGDLAEPHGRRRLLYVAAAVAALAAGIGVVVVSRDDPETGGATPTAAGCREGTTGTDVIGDASTVFDDDRATRLNPTLDFDSMNGSARYARYQDRTYYWGRAGSDDHQPRSGGARVRWRAPGGPWHDCPVTLSVAERGYVHTPAVATTIAGQAVTIQVCLWRDVPYRENCLPEIRTG